jgi:hypothetical protein
MRPVGWSAEEGGGMDVGTEPGTAFDVGDATGVNPLNIGVAIASVGAGVGPPKGVDACSVANRSEVGAAAGPTSPHPRMKSNALVIQMSLVLVIIELN